jgi:hypothetical protein
MDQVWKNKDILVQLDLKNGYPVLTAVPIPTALS